MYGKEIKEVFPGVSDEILGRLLSARHILEMSDAFAKNPNATSRWIERGVSIGQVRQLLAAAVIQDGRYRGIYRGYKDKIEERYTHIPFPRRPDELFDAVVDDEHTEVKWAQEAARALIVGYLNTAGSILKPDEVPKLSSLLATERKDKDLVKRRAARKLTGMLVQEI